MKRRHFVQYSSATAVAALLLRPSSITATTSYPVDEILGSPELLNFLGNDDSVKEIGQRYRQKYREEDDTATLRSALVQLMGERISKKGIRDQVSMDFELGDVVQIKGWVLSLTEARQCALYSLLHL